MRSSFLQRLRELISLLLVSYQIAALFCATTVLPHWLNGVFFSLKTFKNNTEIDVCGYFFFAQFVSLRVIHKQEHGHDTHNREKNVLHLAYTEKISNVFQMKLFWFRIFFYRVLSIFELLIIGLFLGFSCLIGKQKWKTEKMREEYEKRVYYLYDKADYYVDG